jgi:hypothetical protein
MHDLSTDRALAAQFDEIMSKKPFDFCNTLSIMKHAMGVKVLGQSIIIRLTPSFFLLLTQHTTETISRNCQSLINF